MLRIEQVGPKEWTVIHGNYEPIKLNLISSTVTNKYYIVTKFIESVAECIGEEFSNWFMNFLIDCQDPDKRAAIVINNIPTIKKYVNEYLTVKNFDFTQFVDESKAKKNSILFMSGEIFEIIKLSSYLKVYSFICQLK